MNEESSTGVNKVIIRLLELISGRRIYILLFAILGFLEMFMAYASFDGIKLIFPTKSPVNLFSYTGIISLIAALVCVLIEVVRYSVTHQFLRRVLVIMLLLCSIIVGIYSLSKIQNLSAKENISQNINNLEDEVVAKKNQKNDLASSIIKVEQRLLSLIKDTSKLYERNSELANSLIQLKKEIQNISYLRDLIYKEYDSTLSKLNNKYSELENLEAKPNVINPPLIKRKISTALIGASDRRRNGSSINVIVSTVGITNEKIKVFIKAYDVERELYVKVDSVNDPYVAECIFFENKINHKIRLINYEEKPFNKDNVLRYELYLNINSTPIHRNIF